MSFEGEFASYEPLRRIADSQEIKALNARMKIRDTKAERKALQGFVIAKSQLRSSNPTPRLILAIDGSNIAAPVQNGFPKAEEGYITIASVVMDLDKLSAIEKDEFINPKLMRETQSVSSLEFAMPGSNLILENEIDSTSSFRRVLFETLSKKRIFSDGETLLETYEHLLEIKIKQDEIKGIKRPKCPVCEGELEYDYGEYKCSDSGEALFSTDALRLHERMHIDASNGTLFGQVMATAEKLVFVNILRTFERKDWLATLRQVAFFLDGPLAVFDTPSWLSYTISHEIRRINELQKEVNGMDMMIIGLEKSGAFANHFADLDTDENGVKGHFAPQSIFLLDDKYIKKNIIYSESERPYGVGTYFGRKFFYKTKIGHLLVPVVASFSDYEQDLSTAHIEQFSRLADVTTLLDKLSSSRYPDSISPLISAHAEAAIPLNLGKKIFEQMANELKKQNER